MAADGEDGTEDTGKPDKAAGDGTSGPRRRSPRPCPICSKMSVERYHPFCSKRCADIDLGRWLGGRYAVPAEDPPDFAETAPEPPRDDDD